MKHYLILAKVNNKQKVLDRILDDSRIVKLFRMREHGAYSINTTELMNEIEDIHLMRRFRNIRTDEFLKSSQRKVIDWELENKSLRSRVVTIKLRALKAKRLLDEHLKVSTNYILTAYSDNLKQIFTTISARKEAVSLLLEPFSRLQFKLETVLQLADILIADLDAGHWSANIVIEALKLDFDRKSM
jgi:hypothetical protein